MASVTFRDCFLSISALITFVFVFVSGADFVRFVSFRAIYHNLSGAAPPCQGKGARFQSLPTKKATCYTYYVYQHMSCAVVVEGLCCEWT